ncbi:[FeFe] hydrogenase H-cluster radical SAM maturase HydE [Geothrix sp. 21YS21S-4]|uniref:[FeFe] hydrogenase H-cluster radical SAM maturase HydE n=1 Tax=Geothrix sp. 21YS21S-4 TaxID=3068889 RepID=UPI0027B96746|nr:[FeFe] hydrogenase H-cluster radical SAM maturase HydE [Geothrix sp. 21YS21S-4]
MRDLDRSAVEAWLRETEPAALDQLWAEADRVRRERVGDEVHLRGLIEASSHCVRSCHYCGLRAPSGLARYRMTGAEILDAAREAHRLGYGSVVIQAGEDPGLTEAFIAEAVRAIKAETPLAVTLSLGERGDAELAAWKAAGADRYLLRFETSDPALYRRIHPDLPGRASDRFAQLRRMRDMGYEIGTGVMVGIPGQTWRTLAADLLCFREFDMDMIGVGPFLPSPRTPMGGPEAAGYRAPQDQVPNDELTTLKAVALTRLLCPDANLPSTTALATIDQAQGRELALQRGANVVMPNVTPPVFRVQYEIYPGKACVHETATACQGCLEGRIHSLGRRVGAGPGGRRKAPRKGSSACDSHH